VGSIASFWSSADYFRSSPGNGHRQGQVDALKAAGCEKIYSEKVSGKSTDDRRQFKRLTKDLLPGDVVVVCKLDRLARSSRDLHNILHDLAEMDCGFTSLGESWCETSTDIGKLLMTIMGGVAEFERGLIRKRCEEGIEGPRPRASRSAASASWMLR
jgi:DNA invertase Pin-like site-specific DNA recombinase